MANNGRKNEERIMDALTTLTIKCAAHEQATDSMISNLEKHEDRELALLERLTLNATQQTELIRSISSTMAMTANGADGHGNKRQDKLIIILVCIAVAAAFGAQFIGSIIKNIFEVLK